jgi:hypothetical protein
MCSRCSLILAWLLLASILSGCGDNSPALLDEILSQTDAISGWEPNGDQTIFDRENLYDLVNGQADAFFAFGFEQVVVQDYKNADDAAVTIEAWQLGTPADAHGLFTVSIAGAPTQVGNDGDTDPGRRIAFWQDRYFVQVRARQDIDDSDLRAFAASVADALPAGGERHPLLKRLPADGLVERSEIFFHEEISAQDRLWLGEGNPLGLSADTDAALAQYDTAGKRAELLMVQYPTAGGAAAGAEALRNAQLDDLIAVEAKDALLGAVIGEMELATAQALLQTAFSDEHGNP